MLRYRIVFGPLMIGLLLVAFWLDSVLVHVGLTGIWQQVFLGATHLPSGIFLLLISLGLIPAMVIELYAIFSAKQIAAHRGVIMVGSWAACLSLYATPTTLSGNTSVAAICTIFMLSFMATVIWHSRHANVNGVVAAVGATLFALAYCGVLPGFILAFRRWHSAWVLLGVLLMTKSCDIGAYFTGRFLGRHKMIPWLSPGKTWEGLVGGVIVAMCVGMALAWLSQHTDVAAAWRTHEQLVSYHIFAPSRELPATRSDVPVDHLYRVSIHYSVAAGALCGVVFALLGQMGDLTVSAFKRDAGIKDSGHWIPGFGGILDVLDSPLLVVPVAYWLLEPLAQLTG